MYLMLWLYALYTINSQRTIHKIKSVKFQGVLDQVLFYKLKIKMSHTVHSTPIWHN